MGKSDNYPLDAAAGTAGGGIILICKFEYDEDCCNSASPRYMCKCKPEVCNSAVPMTNADRIREMSDEELCGTIYAAQKALCVHFAKALGFPIEELKFEEDAPDILEWLQQPAKED